MWWLLIVKVLLIVEEFNYVEGCMGELGYEMEVLLLIFCLVCYKKIEVVYYSGV